MTDGRADEQTELRWLRHATAVAAVARKNWSAVIFTLRNVDTNVGFLHLSFAIYESVQDGWAGKMYFVQFVMMVQNHSSHAIPLS